MNFIAHYYFYRQDDKYYNLGLVLPDLVKNFCKTHLRPVKKFQHPQLNALNKGSLMHLDSDKRFHNSTFFRQCEDLCGYLLDGKANWPRKFFLNHLLCEILLDRVIIERDTNIVKNFYQDLSEVNHEQVELFLKLNEINNYQNFTAALQRFVNAAFIFDYMHNEKIILALGRVYARLGIQYNWTEQDKEHLMEHIPIILNYIDLDLEKLKTELSK
ncbi:MAG: hypothetical protein JNM67_09445 [Bacteroidetes bacterium]|nr:hypothetical protein [Bacteroidota bacterium]